MVNTKKLAGSASTSRFEAPDERRRPRDAANGGHGMWLANQLCDLVQVRSSRAGTVVRLLVKAPAARTG
jgi:hypothetical protein